MHWFTRQALRANVDWESRNAAQPSALSEKADALPHVEAFKASVTAKGRELQVVLQAAGQLQDKYDVELRQMKNATLKGFWP